LLCRVSFVGDHTGRVPDLVRFVAAISYSLYLTQNPVVLLLSVPQPDPNVPLPWEHTWSWSLTVWVLAIGSAWVVHRWFEKPMMDLRDRHGTLTKSQTAKIL